MINRLEIINVHTNPDKNLEKYVNKKIGQLDHYVPRRSRESLHVVVRLKDGQAKAKNRCKCEVTITLPHEVIELSTTGINLYAAIDSIEPKLKQQLEKYKETHTDPKFYRHLFSRSFRQRGVA